MAQLLFFKKINTEVSLKVVTKEPIPQVGSRQHNKKWNLFSFKKIFIPWEMFLHPWSPENGFFRCKHITEEVRKTKYLARLVFNQVRQLFKGIDRPTRLQMIPLNILTSVEFLSFSHTNAQKQTALFWGLNKITNCFSPAWWKIQIELKVQAT